VLEQCQVIGAVFGLDRLVLQFEARTFEQQQGAAEVGHSIFELLILDAVQALFERCTALLQAGLLVFVVRRTAADREQRHREPKTSQGESQIHGSVFLSVNNAEGVDTSRKCFYRLFPAL